MLIAVLDLRTSATDRALAQLDSERDEIRAMPGNIDFRVYASRDDEEAVAVIHEWADDRVRPQPAGPGSGVGVRGVA